MINPLPEGVYDGKILHEKLNEVISYLFPSEGRVQNPEALDANLKVLQESGLLAKPAQWSESHAPEGAEPIGSRKPKVSPDGSVSSEWELVKDKKGWNLVKKSEYATVETHEADTQGEQV